MASVRLYAVAAGLAVGVLISEALRPAAGAAAGCGVAAVVMLSAAALLARGRRWVASVLAVVAACALGCSVAGLKLASLDRSELARAATRGADAVLEGRVATDPVEKNGAITFTFSVGRGSIDGRPATLRERAAMSVRPPPRFAIGAGDRLRVDMRLAPLAPPGGAKSDPKTQALLAAAQRLRWAGVAARAYARPGGVELLGGPRGPLDVIGRAGRNAVARPVVRLPAREAGLELGVTIGDTSRLDPAIEEDFKTTGLTHLLAVSGENLALFLGAVGVALRLLRAGRRASLAVLTGSLLAFMTITRFEPSVLRAGIMGGVALAGTALGARRETLSALAVAAIALLVADPFIVHAIGFQLSALATLGILVVGPRLRAALPGRVGSVAAITLAAQLAVAPLIALVFHTVSLISLAANLVAVPAVGPATVLGVVAAPLGAIHPWLGLACVTMTRPFLWWMLGSASLFARVPHASIGTPSGLLGFLAVATLVAILVGAMRMRKPPRLATFAIVFGVFLASNVWTTALAPAVTNGLEVTALDVGQGDAILVRADGATMLIDGGPDPVLVMKRLTAHGVRRIDLLVLTHPHADHVTGLTGVVEHLPVAREMDPGLAADLPSYAAFERDLVERHVPRDLGRAGMRYSLGPATVDVLAPSEPLFEGTDSDLNNNAIVMRVTYGAAIVLLAGEEQEEGQQRLLEQHGGELRALVFKVPHHGSARFLRSFYAASGAPVALIPVGPNDYGQPAPSSLDALASLGMRAYRTDRSGDVTVILDARGNMDVHEQKHNLGNVRLPAAA